MTILKKRSVYAYCIIFLFCLLWAGSALAQFMIPEGLVMEEEYQPGLGAAVGEVRLVQGDVVIIHADAGLKGYFASRDLPLFKGDILITQEDGKVSFSLKDGSMMTLTTRTRLVINECIYDEEKARNRTSFVSMALGKVRFRIKKLLDFGHSEFKVKTKTAVVGVRGSDFVVEATEKLTRVTALEDTEIEVVSLLVPCPKYREGIRVTECEIEPVVLTDFEQVVVEMYELPSRLEELLPEEIELMKEEFIIRPDEESVRRQTDEPEIEKGVLVPDNFLVSPEGAGPEIIGKTSVPDILRLGDQPDASADDQREEKLEDRILEIRELPSFPETPDRQTSPNVQ